MNNINMKVSDRKAMKIINGATTVKELINALSTIPADFTLSIFGEENYGIIVIDNIKHVVIDERRWLEENYKIEE